MTPKPKPQPLAVISRVHRTAPEGSLLDLARDPVRELHSVLAEHAQVIWIDHRGSGLSARSSGRYTVTDLALDFPAVLRALGQKTCVLWANGQATTSFSNGRIPR